VTLIQSGEAAALFRAMVPASPRTLRGAAAAAAASRHARPTP